MLTSNINLLYNLYFILKNLDNIVNLSNDIMLNQKCYLILRNSLQFNKIAGLKYLVEPKMQTPSSPIGRTLFTDVEWTILKSSKCF